MALKKKAADAEAKTANNVEENDTPVQETSVPAPKPETAVATSGPSSVFIDNEALVEACSSAEYGTFVAVSASNGEHSGPDDLSLGKEIGFRLSFSGVCGNFLPTMILMRLGNTSRYLMKGKRISLMT